MEIELKEFVEETIKNVLEGVDAARSNYGNRVAPPEAATVKIDGQPAVAAHDGTFWTVVNFDVTVTASKKTEAKAGAKAGFKILLFGSGTAELEGSVNTGSGSLSVQKVSFALPIRLSDMQDCRQSRPI